MNVWFKVLFLVLNVPKHTTSPTHPATMGFCNVVACTFGADGGRATTGGGKATCSLHQSVADLEQLTPKGRDAIVRFVNKLAGAGRDAGVDEAFALLGACPPLLQHVQGATSLKRKQADLNAPGPV